LAALRFIPFIMSVFISVFFSLFHCQKYFKWVQSKLCNAFYLVLGYPFPPDKRSFHCKFFIRTPHTAKATQIQRYTDTDTFIAIADTFTVADTGNKRLALNASQKVSVSSSG